MTNKELAEIMYPDTKWTIEEYGKYAILFY